MVSFAASPFLGADKGSEKEVHKERTVFTRLYLFLDFDGLSTSPGTVQSIKPLFRGERSCQPEKNSASDTCMKLLYLAVGLEHPASHWLNTLENPSRL